MNISSVYGKDISYYAQRTGQNHANIQLQGLERQLQMLSTQKLQAAQGGEAGREEELEDQIDQVEEQLQRFRQERVQTADGFSLPADEGAVSGAPSESRYIDIRR